MHRGVPTQRVVLAQNGDEIGSLEAVSGEGRPARVAGPGPGERPRPRATTGVMAKTGCRRVAQPRSTILSGRWQDCTVSRDRPRSRLSKAPRVRLGCERGLSGHTAEKMRELVSTMPLCASGSGWTAANVGDVAQAAPQGAFRLASQDRRPPAVRDTPATRRRRLRWHVEPGHGTTRDEGIRASAEPAEFLVRSRAS